MAKTVEDIILDACKTSGGIMEKKKAGGAVLDASVNTQGADEYTARDVRLKAAAIVQQWCEADDFDENETAASRLTMMLVGIADANKDGELSDDEQFVYQMAAQSAWEYLSAKGVSDEDLELLFNEFDSDKGIEAADRVRDFCTGQLPDGDEAATDELNAFAFGDEAEMPVFDGAAYSKTIAFRGGKKLLIKKRITGHVRLSAAQKLGLKKAQMKSHSSMAMMKRAKSMLARKKAGY